MNARMSKGLLLLICGLIPFFAFNGALNAQDDNNVTVDKSLYKGLKYRMVGPYRGGRSTAVAGFPDKPFEFLMGGTGAQFIGPQRPWRRFGSLRGSRKPTKIWWSFKDLKLAN